MKAVCRKAGYSPVLFLQVAAMVCAKIVIKGKLSHDNLETETSGKILFFSLTVFSLNIVESLIHP